MCEFEIIIVGGGAAGIAAASRLLENKVTNLIILEASDRIGGRIHSIPFGGGVVDLGCEWVHGKVGNVVCEMADSLDLLNQGSDFFPLSRFTKSNGVVMSDASARVLYGIADGIYDNSDLTSETGSFGSYFESMYWKRVQPLINSGTIDKNEASTFLKWAELLFCSIIGAPAWNNVSVTEHTEYHECEGNQLQIWKQGGYSMALNLLMKKCPISQNELLVEDKVLLNKEVTLIDYKSSNVMLSCVDGSHYQCRQVICTLPLGVLKAKATDIFQPPLPPRHLNAIQGIAIDAIDKIFLEFPYHWWPAGTSGISCLWTPEDINQVSPELWWTTKVFGFYRNDNQPLTVLCGWVGGPAAAKMETLSDEEVKRECMVLLRRFSGEAVKVPEPVSFACSRWYSNPYVRGAYSFRTVDTDKMNAYHENLAVPISNSSEGPVIFFAGEATNDKNHFSTVHGAIESGWREADRILQNRAKGLDLNEGR